MVPEYTPTSPTLVREPFHRDGWVYEERRGRRLSSAGTKGYVAKDEASAYEGGPTGRWVKVKQKDWTDEEDRWRRRISVTR